MEDLNKLVEKAKSINAEMNALLAKSEKVEKKEEKAAIETALEAKAEEFKAIEAEMDVAKAKIARNKMIADALELAKVDDKNVSLTGTPAEPKDEAKEQTAQEDIFVRYVQGKTLSDRERSHMGPKSKNFKEGADGVRIPDHLVGNMLGKRWAQSMLVGKALISEGSGQGEENLVPQDYRAVLLELPAEPDHIMGLATIIPSTTGVVTLPRLVQTDSNEYGGMSFSIISEGAEKPETEPEFDQIEIPTYETAGYTEISIRMLARSAINLQALLSRLYRSGMSAFLDNLFLNGTGVGQPTGIVNTAGIRTQARQTANAVEYEDLVRLKHKVLPHHRNRARFMIHDDVELNLELALDTTDRPLFSASTADGPRNRLVGYPYSVTLRQPSLGSDGDTIFGDFSEFCIASEQEIVIKSSPHYKFRDNLIAFVVYAVLGGRLWQPRAMAILTEPGS